MKNILHLIHMDGLSTVMITVIGFIALSVFSFAFRYLKGDRRRNHFFFGAILLVLSNFILVATDHIFIFLTFWSISCFSLTYLMLHKYEWTAAKASAWLAVKNFGMGITFIGIAFLLLNYFTGETSINLITQDTKNPWLVQTSCTLLLLGAMTQSGLWPFNRWLLSSLNSPTPVSAIMHAGFVNAGGFLLTRFSDLFIQQPLLLKITFFVGALTALLGTFFKLVQSDIKRVLACSTMAQMGFMVLQCGLGLFPAAIAHLCWHSLFKSYLFLSSGSAVKDKKILYETSPKKTSFFLSLIYGVAGSIAFAVASRKNFFIIDTKLFLVSISFIAATHFSLSLLREGKNTFLKLLIVFVLTLFVGGTYGLSVYIVESLLHPQYIASPQPLNLSHGFVFFFFVVGWVLFLFNHNSRKKDKKPEWMQWFYVTVLNASQPNRKTITTHRNHYHN